uniref:ZF(Rab)-2 zinc finger protein n=1 Tax=Phallusia mammillata TaxID=59560 RepID=A0A6F9DRQ5_9ASCI|nr:ZF(Rab)-2 zinc finger protein [Phallusia mammillata]
MELPDISHLTEEEQQQILSVIRRQQDEEKKEKLMIKNLQEQFDNYKEHVKKSSSQTSMSPPKRQLSNSDCGQVCSMCHKTKIMEGCGHTCSYCASKFCSRCGGRVMLKSSKNERMAMWVCNQCRKQQESITKTGAWYNGNQSKLTLRLEPISADELCRIQAAKKMPGSASLAFIEGRGRGNLSTHRRGSKGRSSVNLKKGNSEPQLAKSEVTENTEQHRTGSPVTVGASDSDRNPASENGDQVRPMQGSRRSSTHSEKVLYRQDQTVDLTGNQPVDSSVKDNHHQKLNMETPSALSNSVDQQSRKSKQHLQYDEKSHNLVTQQLKELSQRGDTPHGANLTTAKPENNKTQNRHTPPRTSPAGSVRGHNEVVKPKMVVEETVQMVESSVEQSPYGRSPSFVATDTRTASTVNGHDMTKAESSLSIKSHYSDQHRPKSPRLEHHRHESPQTSRKLNSDRSKSPSPRLQHIPLSSTDVRGHSTSSQDLSRKQTERAEPPNTRLSHGDLPTSPGRKNNRKYVKHYHRSSVSSTESSNYMGTLKRRTDPGGSRRRIEQRQESFDSVDSDAMMDDELSYSNTLPSHSAHKNSEVMYNERHRVTGEPVSYNNYHRQHQNWNRSRFSGSADNLHDNPIPVREQNHFRHRRNNSYHSETEGLQVSTLRKQYNKHRSRTGKHLRRKPSLSSTDEELQSTPDYSSCDDTDRGETFGRRGQSTLMKSIESGYHSAYTIPNAEKQPVSWQPSADGKFLIGNMILNKEIATEPGHTGQSGAILGLKVVGGKMTEAGRLGAFITKVKRGSLADVVGHLKPGDEVIMWNEHCLQDATFDEVYEAVLESKEDKLVELTVSRPIKDVPRIPETRQNQPVTESSSSSFDSQKRDDEVHLANGHRTLGRHNNTQPGHHHPTHGNNRRSNAHHASSQLPGKLEVRLWYDEATQQLYVTTLQAVELPSRPGGLTRNPYVKMYLLPDRSDSSKRRTKTAKKTLTPTWNQSFVYGPIRRGDLGSMALELTIWDLDRSVESNNHFLGEVLIDLGLARLDDMPHWFHLMPMGEGMNQSPYRRSKHFHPTPGYGSMTLPSRGTPVSRSTHTPSHYSDYGSATMKTRRGYVVSEQPRSQMTRHHRRISNESNFSDGYESKMRNPEYRQAEESLTPDAPRSSYPDRAASPCSSSSSYVTGDPRHRRADEHLHEGRVLPMAPGVYQNSNVPEIRSRTSSNARPKRRDADSSKSGMRERNRSSDHSPQPPSSCSKDSLQVGEDYSTQQQAIARRLSSDAHSSVSQQSGEGRRTDVTAKLTNRVDGNDGGSSQRDGGRPRSPKQSDVMSKSMSLGSNLHKTNNKKTSQSRNNGLTSGRSIPRQKSTDSKGSGGRKSNAIGSKITSIVGLKNRSQSTSHIDGSKGGSARSSEYGVQPELTREGSKDSASGSIPSLVSEGSSSVDKTLQDFVGGLGPGQVVGRQTLAASSLGDLELGFYERGGQLEVQVIRARNLVPKANAKVLPAPYVKVYLLFGTECVTKKKTKIARRTLDPAFHQTLTFDPSQYGNTVMVIVWGDYGRMDHKAFMGVVQVRLDNLDLAVNSIGWYRLFPTTSLIDATSLAGTGLGSMTSLESEASKHRT